MTDPTPRSPITCPAKTWLLMRGAGAALGLAALTACAAPAGGESAEPFDRETAYIEEGRAIAESQCSACHALGWSGAGGHPDAKPLGQILSGYDPEALATDLIEGVRIGHPDMPEFHLSPKGADRLIAYLETLD